MKNIHLYLFLLCGILCFSSCELDNYKGPNASLSGSFIDSETGELIESDIINGTKIELIEHGYENPAAYFLVVNVNGTYRHDMLFENTYSIPPIMGGNFVPQTDTATIEIKGGSNTYDFVVQPYIRVKDAAITIEGMIVTATFKLEQTVPGSIFVSKAGLFAHSSPSVGFDLVLGPPPVRTLKTIGRAVDPNEVFTLKLTLKAKDFETGKSYFFRVGAIIDATEAKYNYAPAVRLAIGN